MKTIKLGNNGIRILDELLSKKDEMRFKIRRRIRQMKIKNILNYNTNG